MKLRIITAALLACSAPVHAALVAGWDFETTDTGGTSMVGATPPPTLLSANFGAGTLYLDGSFGSSIGSVDFSYYSMTGSGLNADGDPAFADPSLGAFAFYNLETPSNAVFAFNMLGFADLAISYALDLDFNFAPGTSANLAHGWDFSTDGTNWTPVVSFPTMSKTFELKSVPGISGLDNVSTAFLRLNIGASGTGVVVIDNIRLDATTIPEPGATLILSGLMAACAFYRRRA